MSADDADRTDDGADSEVVNSLSADDADTHGRRGPLRMDRECWSIDQTATGWYRIDSGRTAETANCFWDLSGAPHHDIASSQFPE